MPDRLLVAGGVRQDAPEASGLAGWRSGLLVREPLHGWRARLSPRHGRQLGALKGGGIFGFGKLTSLPVFRRLGKLTFGSRLACALLALRGALPRPGPGGHGWVGPRLVKDVADLGGFKGVGLAAVLSSARPAALRFKAGWLGGGVVRGPVFLWPVRGRPAGWRPVRRGGPPPRPRRGLANL